MKQAAGKVALGVIGTGRIGRIHTENLCRLPQAAVVAVADSIPGSARECAEACGIEHVYEDYSQLLDQRQIQAVVICTSTDSHAAIIRDAAAAGKHIFCEKPIALDVETIDAALAAVAHAGVKLQIGFQRRFDASFRRARELIAAGNIGDAHILRITSRDPQAPPIDYLKRSGGIFLDMTIHDFDMARFLLADEVEEVQAYGSVLIDPKIGEVGDVDTALTVMRFRGGALCCIDNSRKSVYGYDQRVEIFGSNGVVSVGNRGPNAAVLGDARGIHHSLPLHFFLERYQDAYREEMRSFLDAILLDHEPEVSGEDGRAPVVIAHAAMRSLSKHCPIHLSEVDRGRSAKQ